MVHYNIPGFGRADIEHVIFDYNGTIAVDGKLIPGVAQGIETWAGKLTFHVITADTFGFVKNELADLDVKLTIISKNSQDEKKYEYLQSLGPEKSICVGNGMNDARMLKAACIGICILGREGLATNSLTSSDLVIYDILDLFEYFKTPQRLIASLRT